MAAREVRQHREVIAASMIILLLAITAMPSAQAAECRELNRVVEAAWNGFRDIRGPYIGDGDYQAYVVLPNATECVVTDDYDCVWDFDDGDFVAAEAAYEQLVKLIRECTGAEPEAVGTQRREDRSVVIELRRGDNYVDVTVDLGLYQNYGTPYVGFNARPW